MDEHRYYSQNGEDAIVWALFDKQRRPGFFVDVGALDGTRFSNTYSFELAGWKGTCIEAHRDYLELLRKNRPHSVCIHAAVADRDEPRVEFFANRRGALSTLDRTMEPVFRERFGAYFGGFEVQHVPQRTLNTILAAAGAPRPLDVVSIDVEGSEMAVLRGLDLARYRPRVLVIEAAFDGEADEMTDYMHKAGFFRARSLCGNLFFCRDSADVSTIAEAPRDVNLQHTPHPLDMGVLCGSARINEPTER